MTILPPLFHAPTSWVTNDVLAAVPDFARTGTTPTSFSPSSASLEMHAGSTARPASLAERFAKGLACAGAERTELIVGENSGVSASTEREFPRTHTVSARIKRANAEEPLILIPPSWNPLEAAESAAEELMAKGKPGEEYAITLFSLARSGLPFQQAETCEPIAPHIQRLAELGSEENDTDNHPYRRSVPLSTDNTTLYEVRFLIFPLPIITLLNLSFRSIFFDDANREIAFELLQHGDLFGKKAKSKPSPARLRLSASEWKIATETEGLWRSERRLRTSNFWTLLIRELMRNNVRIKLRETFLNAWSDLK